MYKRYRRFIPGKFLTEEFWWKKTGAVPWLRGLVAGLAPRRSGFDPWSVYLGFVVVKVALKHVYPGELRISPVNFIPPVLHFLEKFKEY
jgi:hypothetical protein